MDKRHAIQIMTKAAQLYRDNLEDEKILFLYGLPSEVKMELQTQNKILSSIKGYEVAFHRYNFLHLTGVRLNKSVIASAIHFYEKCLDKRLTENDFSFAKDGSTGQKLDILENMMLLKKNATMIGEFTDKGPKLFAEKAAGNVCGCIGFVKDKNTRLNVPNTLLKKDIRDVIAQPAYKVFAVISKHYTDEKYSVFSKLDKMIDINQCHFSDEIENLIERNRV
ncbi:MAG: PBECR4 domain-containing protein [Lachnospiraceae bacterium]|nr:PBECR4 domain-containing protein [Lachnospiraceae bacterium]